MTKLMNLDLERPKEFFIFCSRNNPMTVHNLTFPKTFTSAAFTCGSFNQEFSKKYQDGTATYLPFFPTCRDCEVPSPHCLTVTNDYRVEFDSEMFRKINCPKYPSRLSAIYAFGDQETCNKVAEKYKNDYPKKWDLSTVRIFSLVEHPLNRVVKVNMEIISLLRYAYRISQIENVNQYWNHYWSGMGNLQMDLPNENFSRTIHESGEIFEYLIDGMLVLKG